MANSVSHQTAATFPDQINKYESKEPFSASSHQPPVTVPQEMLLQSRKERVGADAHRDARGSFKKSHTCGSLFVKCRCDNESLFQTFTGSPVKRSSNPVLADNRLQKAAAKRLSSPEINNLQDLRRSQCASAKSKAWSRGGGELYLGHPEIPFPVVKLCDKQVPTPRSSFGDRSGRSSLSAEVRKSCLLKKCEKWSVFALMQKMLS